MKNIVSKVLTFLANLVPTAKQICFSSFPDYADNAYAMYYYLLKQGVNKEYKFVWEVLDENRLDEIRKKVGIDGNNIRAIKKHTVAGFWAYIRSRYIFETHGMFPILNLKQHPDKHICLWHGMPLKKLGASIDEPSSPNCDYTVASSKLYQGIMAEAFSKPREKVLAIGQPRCDMLFEETDWFEMVGIDRKKYQRIGMWMPTYRKSIIGEIHMDGTYNDRAVTFLEEDDLKRLDNHLVENNTLILLKIHPMDALQNTSFDSFSNIYLIKPQDFHAQLYPLLGACDFLLTDYSSVFIDYQMLRRPIGFVMNDINEFNNSRGLYFDDLEKALPGPILSTYDSLAEFIKEPYYVENGINYNDFFDNDSSARLWDFLMEQ